VIDNVAISTVDLTVREVTVAVGHAIEFRVQGGTAGVTYTVTASADTDATPPETIVGKTRFTVIENPSNLRAHDRGFDRGFA